MHVLVADHESSDLRNDMVVPCQYRPATLNCVEATTIYKCIHNQEVSLGNNFLRPGAHVGILCAVPEYFASEPVSVLHVWLCTCKICMEDKKKTFNRMPACASHFQQQN